MIPAPMIPDPEPLPLPAPLWLLWALLMLTFVLHVVAMNLLVGGSLLSIHARMRYGADVHARALVHRFVRLAPVLVAATVTFGVAPLLFLQVLYGRVFFVSSILMAWFWLAAVPAIILLYYGAYSLAMRKGDPPSMWIAAWIGALLLGIGFVYTNNMTLMLRADRFAALYAASGSGVHLNLGDPTLWPRWLHMMLGAVAVAGLAAASFGVFQTSVEPEFSRWICRYGAGFSALATGLNLVIGMWWIYALPAPVLQRFVDDGVAAAVLAIGAVDAVACFVLLVLLERRPSVGLALGSIAAMLVTVVLMVFARDTIRSTALSAAGFTHPAWIAPQWIPIALFALLLIAAVGTVGWMVRVFAIQSRAEGA